MDALTSGDFKIRSWGNFFEQKSFHLPKDFKDAQTRLYNNVSYFRVNYLVIFGVFLLLNTYLDPWLILPLVFASVVLFLAPSLKKNPNMPPMVQNAGNIEIFSAAALVLLLMCWITNTIRAILWTFGLGALTSIVHSTFRKDSLKAKAATLKQGVEADIMGDRKKE